MPSRLPSRPSSRKVKSLPPLPSSMKRKTDMKAQWEMIIRLMEMMNQGLEEVKEGIKEIKEELREINQGFKEIREAFMKMKE